jgi:hypothetical protein
MKKVVVFIQAVNMNIPRRFMESYLKARTYFQHTMDGYDLVEFFPTVFPPGESRNYCAGKMIEGFKGFLPDISIWLDIDHEIPYDTLVRLLTPDYPIVSGIYYLKQYPHYPIVYKRWKYAEDTDFWLYESIVDYPVDGLFQVDSVGMGCVRIDRDVFLALKKPYFYYRSHSVFERNKKELDFKVRHGIKDNTEELVFFEQATDKGFSIMVDPGIQLKHAQTRWVGQEEFNYTKQMGVFETPAKK